MRLNYCDDEERPGQFALWDANCRRSLRGKAGQSALRRLEAALLALDEKRLIRGRLINAESQVCAIGALAKAEGKLPEPEPVGEWDDDEDCDDTTEFAAARLDVPRLVAWKIVALNDIELDTVWELAHGPLNRWEATYKGGIPLVREMTPEERYEKVLAWVRAQLADPLSSPGREK